MERTIASLKKTVPLQSFNDDMTISVIIHKDPTQTSPNMITIEGLAPFHTIEDLSRAIWLETKDESLYPKYSFLCTNDEDDSTIVKPAMGIWLDIDQNIIHLPNPNQQSPLQDAFVDSNSGQAKPVQFEQHNRITLEQAYSSIPTFHIYSFSYFLALYNIQQPISEQTWNGILLPYFPSLSSNGPHSMTEEDSKISKQIEIYIEAKKSTINILNLLVENVTPPELITKSISYLSFIWKDKVDGFEGVDTLFYIAPVNEKRPYMRLLTPNSVPLTKLYQQDPHDLPFIKDITLLKTWIQDRSPDSAQNCLFTKILLHNATPPLYATQMLFDDGDAQFILQPPKSIRSIDVNSELANLSETLAEISVDMPYSMDKIEIGKANLTVDLELDHRPSKNLPKLIEGRLESLSTIFQNINVPEGQNKPLFMLRYKAVSNFVKEDSISEYLTYYMNRGKFNQEDIQEKFVPEVAKQFEISQDQARRYIIQYIERRNEIVVADPEKNEFIPLVNTGTDIAIYSQGSTFSFSIYNLKSINDFHRITTILSAIFMVDELTWKELTDSQPESSPEEAENVISGEPIEGEGEAINFFEGEEDDIEEQPKQSNQKQPKPLQVDIDEPKEKIVAYQWFIKRLQELDNTLFAFKSTTGVKNYTSQCAANEDRHPSVLTETQYLKMRKIYETAEAEGKVGFILYGVPNTEETIKEAKGKHEQITVLCYSSEPEKKLNYYLCSEYYCLRDLLPVLKEDWESKIDYNNDPKESESCPFCHGTLITDRKNPKENEYVIQRILKPKSTTKRHLFIGFLGKQHPAGFHLPCCFVKNETILWSDERLKSMRDARKTRQVQTLDSEADRNEQQDESIQENLQSRTQQIINYDLIRYRINREYVLSSEKYPLEPGNIGLLNLSLDSYFGQNSELLVHRPTIKQEFKSTTRGMFRIGVLNRTVLLNNSLFAALAPLLGKNTVEEVIRHFTELIIPRIFINLNFGNLLLEFFDPTDKEPDRTRLANWVRTHLQIYKQGSEFELSRFYRSYHRFKAYIKDPKQKKQLRHFIHALAEPNVLVPNGLTLITLEYKGDPREKNTPIDVKCPSLGYNTERYGSNMVGFLTYHSSGIWEPLMYIDRIQKKNTAPIQQEGYYIVSSNQIVAESFPSQIRERYKEFITECRSSYRGAFTYQTGVDSRTLLPVSQALELLESIPSYSLVGIVRDSYNHLVAISIRKEKDISEILVPVVDDGNLFHFNTSLHIHIGIQTMDLASANTVEEFYTNIIMPIFVPISSIYQIEAFLANSENQVFAYRLGDTKGRINLPCTTNIKELQTPIEINNNFQFEYLLNREIIFNDGREDSEFKKSPFLIQKELLENIYEHFRLSFSNWIAIEKNASDLRDKIRQLIERRDIPSFEKIRRLELELSPKLANWFYPDPNPFSPEPTFIRSDCYDIKDKKERCNGYCTFNNGSCKIHIPQMVQVNENLTKIDTIRYLLLRLFDEIIRIPSRSYELLKKGVRRVQVPTTNIHIKDQWIIPENVPAWYTLLQGSIKSVHEEPLYYEEFSRQVEADEEVPQIHIVELPEPIKKVLPQQSISKLSLRIVGSPEDRSGAILRYFGIPSQTNNNNKDSLSNQLIIQIVKKLNKPVVQILINTKPISFFGKSKSFETLKELCVVIIPDFEEGPAIFVTNDTMSEFIPSEYIQGQIFKSIEKIRRVKIKNQVVETVKEQGPVQGPVQTPVQAPRLRILPIGSQKPPVQTPQITEQEEISSPYESPKSEPEPEPVPEPTLVSRLLSMVTNSSQQPPEAPAEPLPERLITRSYKIKPSSSLPQTSVPK